MKNNNDKLGLAWQICVQGLEYHLVCNGGEWEGKLRDIRVYLKLFDGLRDPIKAVTFLSYTEHGAFVVSLAPHTDNAGNYKAVWIYVPNTIEISGDELEMACNKTKDFLLSQRSMDELKSDELFLKTYPEKVDIDYSPSTKENKFGAFYTERYSLSEILGDYLYQKRFSKYDAVFLLNRNEGISIRGYSSWITNLSNERLEKYVVLHCPDPWKISGQPQIYINDEPFVKDVQVKKDHIVTITYKREGFRNKQVKIAVKDERSIDPVKIKELLNERPWEKEISLDNFHFIGEDWKPIKDKDSIKVKVNGKEVGNGCILEEGACESAEIEVDSENYELAYWVKRYNLLRAPVTITLKRKKKTIATRIQLANDKEADITLESKHFEDDYINREKSPLKGYRYGTSKSTLHPDKTGKWKSYAIGASAMLIIVIILGIILFCNGTLTYNGGKLPPSEQVNVGNGLIQEQQPVNPGKPNKDLTQVLSYLDGNDVWSKKELDRYPETEELFDALNRFDGDEVERIYKEKLSEQSTKLKQIVDAFSNNREKDFRRGKEANNGLYNKENDYKINVANYINWLSNYHAPTTSQQPTTRTGQTSGNIGSSETKESTGETAKTSDPRNVADQ